MADFQYIKLPDGSYGKFASDASDATIRGAIENDFPDAFNAKPAAPVPAELAAPKDPELKPFFSSDAARDEGSGILKMGAQGVLSPIAHAVGHIPGAYGDSERQALKDLDEYSHAANKDEQFGKIGAGGIAALPALYTGGEFAGGLYDELAPVLEPLAKAAGGALGKVATKGAGKLATGALLGTGYEARHQIGDLLRKFF